jgi:hypothetical protein
MYHVHDRHTKKVKSIHTSKKFNIHNNNIILFVADEKMGKKKVELQVTSNSAWVNVVPFFTWKGQKGS